jgi:polysaccharide pyruvyl transferase WcaK-like protein
MKIGILTFHHAQNYGSVLQAYALFQLLSSEGHDCEFIDYRPWRALIYYAKDQYLTPLYHAYSLKSKCIQRFIQAYLPLSQDLYHTQKDLSSIKSSYDLILCGSDEVWNIESIRKFDACYFLNFAQHTRKASYAASFGSTKDLGSYQFKIGQLLQDFDCISVRDANSRKLVERASGRIVINVLDPTFLADFEPLILKPTITNYILVYGRLKTHQRAVVKKFADARGLKIVAVGYFYLGADLNDLAIGPEAWLGYFANASYIFTDHYHGIIFSIIFKKPFTLFQRLRKYNKNQDLLNLLGLEDRISSTEEINYHQVYQKLSVAVADSFSYLVGVIRGQCC